MTRRIWLYLVPLMLLAPLSGWANGNYSHVWVSTDALNYLEDGELKELLTTPELTNILRNGAMYPDGGYAVGDNYGEISHWEPFHLTYLGWIRESFSPPWDHEAKQHIAFLLGMATHGMSDQLYDGMYLTRHGHYDDHGSEATMIGVDGATDACFAVAQGKPLELPEQWLPAETLAPLYEQLNGHKVTPETLVQGHTFVAVAILAANDGLNNPEQIAEYMELYPYACGNQNNPEAPGSPPTHSPAVAAYWQVLWGRLHGEETFDQPLLGTFFTGGTPWDQPTDASNPDSWVHFSMPRGLNPGTVNEDTVVVTDSDGAVIPVDLHVYYGNNSHLVNVKPQEDWPDATLFTVTISPPITSWDGVELGQTHSFEFATMPQPVAMVEEIVEEIVEEVMEQDLAVATDTVDAGQPDVSGTEAESSGGCSMQGQGNLTLLPLLLLLLALFFNRSRRHESI